ncbi:FAD-dependent tricarballylate dehydrogenase TcuA [Rhodopseudomonas palustris]|uniref:FAD-dependent tricarballylate dehydrogenase TcuA n=1 Tax=Rhodopseudomonas palustris TaxID=1076 RepID=A0A418UYM5_RHOPL|nr:FAD-dependent tricarballylate dehydrogenase TcuA [Rhodopseudomonas palustris]RJF68355.1 FAD-dependent tricarballylate dehydrogenase TcuA [Rhodopseudomonas palustris]
MNSENQIVVVGGGIAGLCAAIAARRIGASVHLLDNAPAALRGGNARHARNFRVVHPEPTPFAPGSYQSAEFLAELDGVAGGVGDRTLAERLVAGSETLVPWLMENGVTMQTPSLGVVPYSRRTVFPLGGGKAMINALYRTAAALGIMISNDTSVTALRESTSGWRVDLGSGGENAATIQARRVIVCAGSPGADPAWLTTHYGAAGDGLMIRGTRYADGRLLDRLLAMGAQASGDPTVCHMVAVDARGPRFDGGIVTRITAIPHGMVVDASGARIDAAGAGQKPTHYARWGPRIAACDRQTAYLILDADGLQRAAPQAFAPIEAKSIAALAAALDCNPATLEAAVAEFNAAPTTSARPVTRAPFAAYPMRAGITFVHHGVAVDDRLRVVWTDGRTNDTLFAAGMIMAANVLRRGYLAGLGLTLAAVIGRLAGEEAARHVIR